MRPYRVLLRGQGVFFAAQSSADCITSMAGFDLRQAQVAGELSESMRGWHLFATRSSALCRLPVRPESP
jgi:hypothetical protein